MGRGWAGVDVHVCRTWVFACLTDVFMMECGT